MDLIFENKHQFGYYKHHIILFRIILFWFILAIIKYLNKINIIYKYIELRGKWVLNSHEIFE